MRNFRLMYKLKQGCW